MSAVTKITEKKILRELVPLNTLSQTRFEEISGKIVIEEVREGSYLFRIDDRDMQTVFLLGGEIDLLDDKHKSFGTIKAGSGKSRFPIADAQPRILSARAVKKCVVARIDSSLLEAFLSWDQSNDAEAVVIGANEDEDWMTRMLQSQAFEKIPPAKIQQLLLKMDAVRFKAGATVIRQGEHGDSFYTIKSGKCAVTRKDTPQAEARLLAELVDGDCFGEEALVLDIKRNATVSMLTDGVLMRLAKQDFVELLQKQLVRYVDYEKAAHMIDEGAIWVDVRNADEYDSSAIEDSVNIPLSSVRREMHDLVFNVAYILCCDTGLCSTSAAFILCHRGFDVYVLEGGLPVIPENIFHQMPDDSQAAPEVATRIDGSEQQISTLHDQKEKPESGLAGALEQQALLERQLDELKNLHEQDRQQLARDAEGQVAELQEQLGQADERNARDKSGMQKELDDLAVRTNENIESKERECVELKQQQSRLLEDLDAMQNERDSLQQILDAAVNDAAGWQQETDALHAQLASVTDGADEQLRELQARLESGLAEAHEQQASLERQLDELKNLHEQDRQQLARDAEEHERSATALQDEARRLEASLNKQTEEINQLLADKQVAAETLNRHIEEWDGERALLMSGNEETQQRVKELEEQLEEACERNARDKSGMQEECDGLQRSLDEALEAAAYKQKMIDALSEQLASATGSADEHMQALDALLETMRLQLEEAGLQAADRFAQLNSMQEKWPE